jgi:hypothetical protein
MGRMYSAHIEGTAATAQVDFFEVVAPSDAVVIIHGVWISQSSDVDSEQLRVAIKRGSTTSGSGGSAFTPNPHHFGDAAFGGTVEVMNTTKATSGTITTHHSDSFNVLNGWVWLPTPEMRLILSPSQRMTVELLTTPADSLTFNGTIVFEELGG